MFIGFLLSLGLLGGYTKSLHRWFNLPLSLAFFSVISVLALSSYGFALAGQIHLGAVCILAVGLILWLCQLGRFITKSHVWLSVLLLLLGFVYVQGLQFSVVDDFAYWGIIGKYIFYHQQLPTLHSELYERHLSYPPGIAVWHYPFFKLFQHYSADITYFAQNFLIFATIFVIYQRSFIHSVFFIGVFLFLLTITYGFVFANLQVDVLLSLYFFAILWIYFVDQTLTFPTKLLIIAAPILYLCLIKEVGFFLSLCLLFIIGVYSWQYRRRQLTFSKEILFIGLITISLIFIKFSWSHYWHAQGFQSFNNSLSWASALHSFNLQNMIVRNGLKTFLQAIFFAKADHLSIPYIVWYGILSYLWWAILKYCPLSERSSYRYLLICLGLFYLAYLFFFYIFEISTFNLGNKDAPLPVRYINIFFAACIYLTIFIYLKVLLIDKDKISAQWAWVVFILALVLIGGYRLPRAHTSHTEIILTQEFAKKISAVITSSGNKVCIIHDKSSRHSSFNLYLSYYLLPNTVNTMPLPLDNQNNLQTALTSCQYLLVYYPESQVQDFLNRIFHQTIVAEGFYHITHQSATNMQVNRIF